jgi:membrane glycosyltransferase
VLYLYNPAFFWWITPILVPLLLAVPVSVLTSKASLGLKARDAGLFLTPEETSPPEELEDLAAILHKTRTAAESQAHLKTGGFGRAVVDPPVFALHLGLLRPGNGTPDPETALLIEKALSHGPAMLEPKEKLRLLFDPAALAELHKKVWQLPAGELSRHWSIGT